MPANAKPSYATRPLLLQACESEQAVTLQFVLSTPDALDAVAVVLAAIQEVAHE